jgi:class 3 adenylate cyclase
MIERRVIPVGIEMKPGTGKNANLSDMAMTPNVRPLFSKEEKQPPSGETWLTGNELVETTGISKRDLIRFIQLRVLPKRMMRVSNVDRDGVRKISYFSTSIVEHVSMLKRLRDQGYSVEEIASEMRVAAEGDTLTADRSLTETQPAASPPEGVPEQPTPQQVHLPVEALAAATFFVNRDLRIGWIKAERGDRLTRAIKNELADDPTGTVFDIMLRASLKELVFNWQPLFSFAYRFLQTTTSPDTFNRLAPTISLIPGKNDHPQHTASGEAAPGPIDSVRIRLEDDDGHMQNMRIYGIAVSEGTLFVLNRERQQDSPAGGRDGKSTAASEEEPETASGKTIFSVISARLDDSRSIVDTLLPETYFQLMTRVWDESDRVVASYGGRRAKRSGTEVQYVIPRHAGTDPAYDAIRCAVELRDKMREIEASLKAEGGWFSAIRLNIGISSGKDRLEEEDPTASMAFMLPGGAADQAFHLSAIAHGGAIWITKSAFSHLTPQQIKPIRFGIYRDDRLIPNIFAQVSDLPHAPDTPPLGRGIRSLSVTRIIDIRARRSV